MSHDRSTTAMGRMSTVVLPCGKSYLVTRSGPVPHDVIQAQHQQALMRCGCPVCLRVAREDTTDA